MDDSNNGSRLNPCLTHCQTLCLVPLDLDLPIEWSRREYGVTGSWLSSGEGSHKRKTRSDRDSAGYASIGEENSASRSDGGTNEWSDSDEVPKSGDPNPDSGDSSTDMSITSSGEAWPI